MKSRAVSLAAVAAVLAGTDAAVPSPARADATARGSIAWEACATADHPTLQCATVEVPLDHDRPDGATVELALSRVPHTARRYQGPLLVNPGGPGAPGRALAGFVASALPAEVAAGYDIVGFDPRGVGASRPALDCRPGHFAPVRPDPVPASAANERANLSRARSFAEACAAAHPEMLPHLGTVPTAHDLEAVRAALGAPRINYLGYSYGTYLGAVYAKLYPERVRRLVLDSAVDPTAVWYEANLRQDVAFDERHRAFLDWVARHDADYGLGTSPARIEASWYRMRAALARRPAEGVVGAAEVEDTFLPGAYYEGYWPLLAEVLTAYLRDGDHGPLVAAYRRFGAVDAAGDNGYSVYTAVECRDAQWPRDWRDWRADNWSTHARAPFLTWNNAWYNAPCAFWPVRGDAPSDVGNDALPASLIFQATDDAATPYVGGLTLRRLLGGSSLVVEDGGGNHGITLSGNACLDRHLVAYLDDGTVPRGEGGVDARCAALPEPEPGGSGITARASRGLVLHGLLGFRA
ncbi:alpha/beta hydrolase [Streptomyces sp. HSG2]|uniref:alpha/beta hydrolase n=1 Tax=Streptomyces sp. HSG2 TaxID=2797167 RepID=UPI001903299C|nr:alpha/beta hydrolase [Streptomyces sp. HSG2]